MAQIAKSAAMLRISGDKLVPTEITKILDCEPTKSHIKGENIAVNKTGKITIAKSGMWRLVASEQRPENLDAQIEELLGKLSNDLDIWQEIGSKFSVDLFVGLFMNVSNEGMELSSSSLKKLGDRGILLGMDIYDPS